MESFPLTGMETFSTCICRSPFCKTFGIFSPHGDGNLSLESPVHWGGNTCFWNLFPSRGWKPFLASAGVTLERRLLESFPLTGMETSPSEGVHLGSLLLLESFPLTGMETPTWDLAFLASFKLLESFPLTGMETPQPWGRGKGKS